MVVKSIVFCLVFIVIVDAVEVSQKFMSKVPKHVEERKLSLLKSNFNPQLPPLQPASTTKGAYTFATDVGASGSLAAFKCLYNQGYSTVFIQAYSPAKGGSLNPNVVQNIYDAGSAILGNEVYVTPVPTGKTGQTQFDAVFNHFKTAGITLRTLWLQVTSPIEWQTNVQKNVNLIQAFVSRANAKNVTVGIYTNWYDWQEIAGPDVGFRNVRLWYWSAIGEGPSSESQATFDDFRHFGGWTKPSVKQFALNESLCGMTLNRSVYPSGTKNAESLSDRRLVAGGFI